MADTPQSTGNMGKPRGKSGTLIYSGYISSEEYNKSLVGKAGRRIFDEMSRGDTKVAQAVRVCRQPLINANFKMVAASDDEADQHISNFIKRELFERNISFPDLIRDATSKFIYGFALCEQTWEMTEFEGKTRIGIKEIAFRKQISIERWETQDGKPGVTQMLKDGMVDIPESKLLYFVNEREGDNYEGISLIRSAYGDWYIKQGLIKINAIGLEKQGIGVPVITHAANATEDDKEIARDSVRQFRANEEAYIEKVEGTEIEMLDMKGQTTKEILPSIEYHNRQIVGAVLAQFLELAQGSNAGGGRALSEDHSKLLHEILEAAGRVIVAEIQRKVINRLCDQNFTDLPNGYPRLELGKLSEDDLSVLSAAVKNFKDAGLITPTFDTEQTVRQIAHLPELPEDYKVDYEKKREMALNPPQPTTTHGTPTDTTTTDKTLTPDQKKKAAESKKAARQRAIETLHVDRDTLLDVVYG
jgi:phage gp29-like protein